MPRLLPSILLALFLPATAWASPSLNGRRHLEAVRTSTPPVLDGRLDDTAWAGAPAAKDFVQVQPDEGKPSRFQTDVYVAFDDDNVYVAARMYDPHPEEIRRLLVRRDTDSMSDTFAVAFDSYHDRRTAYAFLVNASGVQRDVYLYDDTNGDERWDAVWRSAVRVDKSGWVVEMAIPLSQIRFNVDTTEWGLQFMRLVARAGEQSIWQPIPKSKGVEVSGYGDLDGLQHLSSPGYFELLPYVASGARVYRPDDPADPFHTGRDFQLDGGLDLKYGLGSDWTLNATVNPDFGQVEADPAQVNLSDSQLFYPERRPFFLEGLQIFGGNLTTDSNGNPNTNIFYSRRIGAAPLGEFDPPTDDAYVDRPEQTRILGAAKLTGRSSGGTSVGLLEAVTSPEWERYAGPGVPDGAERRIQPLSNYLVARVQQDLHGGDSQVGAIATAVDRALDSDLALQLPRAAYAGGLDWNLGFQHKRYYLSGQLYGSRVSGDPTVMEDLQTNFTRYAQRPDASHLSVDPDARSLTGLSGDLRFGQRSGEKYTWEMRAGFTTPFFEVNDLGFENRADELRMGARAVRRETKGQGTFRDWQVGLDLSATSSMGQDFLGGMLNLFANAHTRGYQYLEGNVWVTPPAMSDRLLRGGPLASTPARMGTTVIAATDGRKPVELVGWTWGNVTAIGTMNLGAGAEVVAHPLEALSIDVQAEASRGTTDAQYVTAYDDPAAADTYGERYVFADLDQIYSAVSGRVEWTFSPRLSLQTYVRGTVVTGAYGPLKWFVHPQARDFTPFDAAGGTLEPTEDGYLVRAAGSDVSEAVDDPAFTFTGLQGNAVLRWEWRPGSTLFLVYQLDCSDMQTTDGRFRIGDWGHLCGSETPEHTLLVKGTWWWSF